MQKRLAAVYDSVDDIDLWIGGLAEDDVPQAMVGPLFFETALLHWALYKARTMGHTECWAFSDLIHNGYLLDLTPVEFRLLSTLFRQPGRVFSRDQLIECVYTDHRVVTDRTVDTHVKNLRRKLKEQAPDSDPIRSVYGVGYKLEFPGT